MAIEPLQVHGAPLGLRNDDRGTYPLLPPADLPTAVDLDGRKPRSRLLGWSPEVT
jgi:hypothetical protein